MASWLISMVTIVTTVMASKMEDEESEQIELSGADSMSEGTTSNCIM